MLNKHNLVPNTKLFICVALVFSLSGCYLSFGSGKNKKEAASPASAVVVQSAPAAAPIIINSTQSAPSNPQTERHLQPTHSR